jgi:hypothetical protein
VLMEFGVWKYFRLVWDGSLFFSPYVFLVVFLF